MQPTPVHLLEVSSCREGGFSYIEALVALVILAVALIPAMEALTGGVQGVRLNVAQGTTAGTERNVSDEEALRNKMEGLLARTHDRNSGGLANSPSGTSTAHGYSDAAGTDPRCLVYTSWYKPEATQAADRFVSTDTGLLWIKVVVEGKATHLETVAFIP